VKYLEASRARDAGQMLAVCTIVDGKQRDSGNCETLRHTNMHTDTLECMRRRNTILVSRNVFFDEA
jgi:hypothetical protein